jgi:hypothetical protein
MEPGLVGYWPMTNLAGYLPTNNRDTNNRNGSVASTVYPVSTGMNALTFDGGIYAEVTLPNTGFANFTTGLSAGVWVYPTSVRNWSRFFNFGTSPYTNNDSIFFARSGTTNDLVFYAFNGSSGSSITASNAIELNKWQYFSVSMAANGTATIYKNGVSIASGTVNVPRNTNRTKNHISFAGQMSDLSVWNRPLSQTELSSAMSTLFTGNETGLVGYWPMKELTSSTTVTEVSPAARNGTSNSGVTSAIAPAGRGTVPFNSALKFDGSTGSATLPGLGFTDFTGGFSAGIWVYPTSTASNSRLFDFGNGADQDNIFLARSSTSNDLNFSVRRGATEQKITASNVIELNKWQYFSVSQQANGSTTIYKNGVAVASGTVAVGNYVSRVYY